MRLHFEGSERECSSCAWPDVCRADRTCWTAEAEEDARQARVRRSFSPFFVRTGGTDEDPRGYIDTRSMEAACVAAGNGERTYRFREDARRRHERRAAEVSVDDLLAGRAIALAALMNVKRFRDLEDRLNHGFRFRIDADGMVRPDVETLEDGRARLHDRNVRRVPLG